MRISFMHLELTAVLVTVSSHIVLHYLLYTKLYTLLLLFLHHVEEKS